MKKEWKYRVGFVGGMMMTWCSGIVMACVMQAELGFGWNVGFGLLLGLTAMLGAGLIDRSASVREHLFWADIVQNYDKLETLLRKELLEARMKIAQLKERDRRIFERSEERWAERRLQEGADDDLHG